MSKPSAGAVRAAHEIVGLASCYVFECAEREGGEHIIGKIAEAIDAECGTAELVEALRRIIATSRRNIRHGEALDAIHTLAETALAKHEGREPQAQGEK